LFSSRRRLRTIWRANCVICASSIARSDGCQRIGGMAIHGVAFPADYIQMGPDQRRDHRTPEAEAVGRLLAFQPGKDASGRITSLALRLAQRVRATPPGPLSAESFLRRYGLSTREGVALMCVAEALLRIPDPQTADALLRDKLSSGNWGPTKDDASFVSSAADWALMLTGTLARWREAPQEDFSSNLKQLVARLGEPVARAATRQAMRILAEQFVLAETIEEAVGRANARRPYRFSFDMLGAASALRGDEARPSLFRASTRTEEPGRHRRCSRGWHHHRRRGVRTAGADAGYF